MFRLHENYLKSVIRWRTLVFEAEYVLNGEKELDYDMFNDAMHFTYEVFKEIGYREDFSLSVEEDGFLVPHTITLGEYTKMIRLMSQYITDFSFYKSRPIEFRASQLAAALLLHKATSDFNFSEDDVLSDALIFEDKKYKYSYDITNGDLSEIMEALKEYRKNFE